MSRSSVRTGWLALLATVLVMACAPAAGPSGSAAIATTTVTATAPSSPAAEACTIEQAPGPGDEPSSGGETDTSDQAGGRFAACLIGPPGDRLEGTAWCTWTPDRIAVQEVTGLPTAGSAGLTDVYLDLRTGTIQVSLTLPEGTVITYAQADVPGAIRDDGSDGLMAFDAALADGSASPPPGTSPRQTGTFRWQCAGPPPA